MDDDRAPGSEPLVALRRGEALVLRRVIDISLVVILAASAAFLFPGVYDNPLAIGVLLGTLALMLVAAAILVRRERLAAARVVLMSALLGSTVGAVMGIGGIQGPNTVGFVLVVLIAGLMGGRRLSLVFAVISTVLGLGIAFAEHQGYVPPLPTAPIPSALAVVTTVWLVTVFLGGTLHRTRLALEESQLNAERAESRQARIDELVQQSPDGIVVLTPEGIVEDINASGLAMGGFERHRIVGKHLTEIPGLDEIALASSMDSLEKKMPTEGRDLLELEATRVDGSRYWVELHSQMVTRADGSKRVQVVARDVSERKEAEATRTALEQQLRDARRMEAIGRLAGGVAHDFNNLLTAIVGNVEMLRRYPLPPDAKQDLLEVSRAADRASALTDQLLAFARRKVLEPRIIDVNETIEGVQGLMRRLIPENIELRLSLGSDPLPVLADPAQIEQVILNLAVNARDAMPSGGALVIQTNREELGAAACEGTELSAGPYVEITVRDTGSGMDEETRRQIFEPFFTTKGEGHGTGLGLATVHGVVAQSGGDIRVETRRDHGTMFLIRLPLSAQPVPASASDGPRLEDLKGSGELVLVVDDESLVRNTASRILRMAGYEVIMAEDGENALEIAASAKRPIALLLTDVVMPRKGGFALAEELTRARPGLRVLFMSGYTAEAETSGVDLVPGTNFVPKPFDPLTLRLAVRTSLDGAAVARTTA